MVEEKILSDDSIMKFVLDNLYIKNSKQMNTYYRAVKILENLGTYLLRGQYKQNNIMTIFNIRNAAITELPVSSVQGNAEDLIYSSTSYDDNNTSLNARPDLSLFKSTGKKEKITNYQKYKDQKTTKINKLKKTKFKNKNIYGEWALVDTEGVFVFNNKRFKISDKCNQYQGKLILVSGRKKDKEYEYRYDMDKILCYIDLDSNTYYFYDEKINDVTNFVSLF